MPSLSISAYMRKVVNGVRNSCVTAETNAPRRSLREMTPLKRTAAATAANSMAAHASNSDKRMGERPVATRSGSGPGSKVNGSEANRRDSADGLELESAARSACGSRSEMPSSSCCLIECQSSKQPCKYSSPPTSTRRARINFSPSHKGDMTDICTSVVSLVLPFARSKLGIPEFCAKLLLAETDFCRAANSCMARWPCCSCAA